MGLRQRLVSVRTAARRIVARQSRPLAIVAGAAVIVSGVAELSEPIARILAGLLVIVFFGIEFGRTR